MNHSTWDLEVHVREMQRRRLREADRARQIEAARQPGYHPRVRSARFSVARFMTALWSFLSPRRSAIPRAATPASARAALLPLPLEELRLRPDALSSGLSQPYAGMVVLARGTSAQNPVQPCAAGDC
jgi:hypothetical protein